MASIGKGRGWARADNETVLRRPGNSQSAESTQFDKLIDKIYEIKIEVFPETPPKSFAEVMGSLRRCMVHISSKDFENIWNRVLNDRCFAIKIAIFNRMLALTDLMSGVFRKYTLESMQSTFEKREELQKENPLHLTNLAWVLGTIVDRPPTSDDPTRMWKILGEALLDCLNLLLDTASEDETETVAIHLCAFGQGVMKLPNIESVVKKARRILVERNVSARTRAHLLLIIEQYHRNYEPLTGDLLTFYTSNLEPSHTQEADTKYLRDREFNQQAYLYNLLLKQTPPKEEENLSSGLKEVSIGNPKPAGKQPSEKSNWKQTNPEPTPRAIRGSGASKGVKDLGNDQKNAQSSTRQTCGQADPLDETSSQEKRSETRRSF